MSEDRAPENARPESDVPDRFTVDFTGVTLLGSYEVTEKLAEGGMGSVYRGQDTNLGRPVVIKVPHVRFLGEPGFRKRFAREISELVRLEHPNIVNIIAQGTHEDVPFFVLQFLGGGSLEDVFEAREGAGSPPDLYLRWLRTIAKTLDFVHARGTIHRDVKPANVLFDDGGHVFLSDFGVAKAVGNEDANLTEAGTGIGSPRYMAPEQGYGHDLTPAADQYALASMVYEAAAGRPPFLETSPIELLVKKGASDPESLCDLVPDLPAEAGAAVMRGLARKPEDRHASCRAIVEAFEAGLHPEPAPLPSPSPRRRVLFAAVALIPLLVVVLILARDRTPTPAADVGGATNEAGAMRLTLVDGGAEPRRTLRYAPETGAAEAVNLSITQKMDMVIGGKPLPLPKNPTVKFALSVQVDDVAKNGDIHMSWTTSSVTLEGTEEIPEEAQPHLERLMGFYDRFAGNAVFAPNGLTRSSELKGAEDLPKIARGQIESVWWVIRNIAMPFPVEPVGVGARWEVSETVDMMGMRIADTTTFVLESLSEDGFEIRFLSAQTAAEQKITTFDFGEEKSNATLLSHHGRSKGLAGSDYAHLTPADFEFALIMDMKVLFADMETGPDTREDVNAEMHIEISMTVVREAD